ncbi:hypothetical protein IKG60_01145 [Candidatus Saccharibacteria bacterium]|nr:hypothetical protein [Candidatus Saccharibacteria bacterium]
MFKGGAMMENLGTLMTVYEIVSGVGSFLQIALVVLKRPNNILLIFGLLLDVVSLSGMSCGHILSGKPLFAVLEIAAVVLDVAFILHILYKEKHPQSAKI